MRENPPNRLRLHFRDGGDVTVSHRPACAVGHDAAHGLAALSALVEPAPPARCGCAARWQLGEFTMGTGERFGWAKCVSHSPACRTPPWWSVP